MLFKFLRGWGNRASPQAPTDSADSIRHEAQTVLIAFAEVYTKHMTPEQIAQPFVGVASCWNEAAPCNIALMRQAQSAKRGVDESGNQIAVFGRLGARLDDDELTAHHVLQLREPVEAGRVDPRRHPVGAAREHLGQNHDGGDRERDQGVGNRAERRCRRAGSADRCRAAAVAAGRSTINDPYALLKDLTRGKRLSGDDMVAFVNGLEIGDEAKERLLKLRPHTYTGLASELAKRIQ